MTRRRMHAAIALAFLCAACVDRNAPPPVCAFDYDRIKADELTDLGKGDVVVGRLLRREATRATLFDRELADLERYEAILASRSRPVDALDLALLDNALGRLDDAECWDPDDDRVCAEDDDTVSLYCALYFASIDYLDHYEFRRTAIQEVRFAIDDVSDASTFEHPLTDFNNLPRTTLADVQNILGTARDRIAERLAAQAECEVEY